LRIAATAFRAALRALAICALAAPSAEAGRIQAFLGSGMNFGSAARFRPYLSTENVNYIPHAGLSVIPDRDWKYSGTWTWVDAHSFCLFCDSRLEEKYSRLNLGAARNILHDSLISVFLGADIMRQTGVNTYSRAHMGIPNGDSYSGALIDRYVLMGTGFTAECSFAAFMSGGTRVGYSWLRERRRSNTLVESLGDGDEVHPLVFDSGRRGAPVTVEVFFRLSLTPIRW
jgi:hypothetical protein